MGLKAKIVVILLIAIFALNTLSTFNYIKNCRADDILTKYYVDNDYNDTTPGWLVDHFDNIQDAIDKTPYADRIIVFAGEYNETITINHRIDLFGEDNSLTTITGMDTGNRITINAKNVNISHFKIRNCGDATTNAVIQINYGNAIITDNIIESGSSNGIYIDNVDDNTIYDNTIQTNNASGIWFNHSDDNLISYNTIINNRHNGLFLYNSNENDIENNNLKNNDYNGIFLNETCDDNEILNNNISSNTQNGLFLNDHCEDNDITNNQIYNNGFSGIRLENSSSNTIYLCKCSSNTDYGILVVGSENRVQTNEIKSNRNHGLFLFADNDNYIISNTISDNYYNGIYLSNSTSDEIYNNEINGNQRYGLYLDYFTTKNLIYNNYFHDNNNNADDKSLNKNSWNYSTISPGPNIIGGPYISGNYWDDFDERVDGVTDPDGDGISNTSHSIGFYSHDYGTLIDVEPPEIDEPQLSSETQVAGNNLQISADVIDSMEVRDVYLILIDPNNQTSNFSILQNKTGDTYYCNKQYTIVGTYNYTIVARDTWNWNSSTPDEFYIDQGTAPSVTDNTELTASPSRHVHINVTVVDDVDASSYLIVKVEWEQGNNTNGGNYTMDYIGNNYFKRIAPTDNTLRSVYYKIYVCDLLGNTHTTETKSVSIIDTKKPDIEIKKYGSSQEILPDSYTFGATITDDNIVGEVNIEYWYEGSNKLTVEMDEKDNNYYEKTLVISEKPNRVYCVIYTEDPSGNQNDTKKPFANASGPYTGVVGIDVTFNGSNSFDLDGNITEYLWDFGDGTTGSGPIVNHIYRTNGNYDVSLTVTDDEENTRTDYTYASIIPLVKNTVSTSTLNQIKNLYNIQLNELFYTYDTTGDNVVDKFIDPNNILKTVHEGNIDIDGNNVFLISIDDQAIPEFMWDTDTDKITIIKHLIGTINETTLDENEKNVDVIVSVNKTDGWIFIEIENPNLKNDYTLGSLVSVKRNTTSIDEDKIFNKNGKSYVLDDPFVEYIFTYKYSPPTLGSAAFNPNQGELINEENKTISIRYNVPVNVSYAVFYRTNELGTEIIWIKEIMDDLKTDDFKTYTFTPEPNLVDGMYYLELDVITDDGTIGTDSIYYHYQSYYVDQSKLSISFNSILMIIGIIGGACVAILLVLRLKKISLDSFIYFKNKKIIPFFKPLIIGPLRIDVNDKKVKKAEFYINGMLKDTLTEEPYVWNWNETSFMKKTIETKIYDQDGNISSSGEMTFFVFNSPKIFN